MTNTGEFRSLRTSDMKLTPPADELASSSFKKTTKWNNVNTRLTRNFHSESRHYNRILGGGWCTYVAFDVDVLVFIADVASSSAVGHRVPLLLRLPCSVAVGPGIRVCCAAAQSRDPLLLYMSCVDQITDWRQLCINALRTRARLLMFIRPNI